MLRCHRCNVTPDFETASLCKIIFLRDIWQHQIWRAWQMWFFPCMDDNRKKCYCGLDIRDALWRSFSFVRILRKQLNSNWKSFASQVTKQGIKVKVKPLVSRVREVTKIFCITSKSTYFCPNSQGLLQKNLDLKTITTSTSETKFLDCPQPYPKVS